MKRPTLDEALDMIDACVTIEQLFTVSSQLAIAFEGMDNELQLLSDMAVHQLELICDKETTKESIEAGRIQPMVHSGVMAKA